MDFHVSPELYASMLKDQRAQERDYIDLGIGSIAKILAPRIMESRLFPFDMPCDDCGSTGADPADGAYCRRCAGAGGTKTIGVMIAGAQTTVIQARLPKLFPPRFPRGFVRPRNPVKIVL